MKRITVGIAWLLLLHHISSAMPPELLPRDRILVLDFGSPYTPMIVQRVREMGVYARLAPYAISMQEIAAFNPQGIILSGGPASVTQLGSPRIPHAIFESGIPLLGICYGMQAMAVQLGGSVREAEKGEYGPADLLIQHHSILFSDIALPYESGISFAVYMSHGDRVVQTPPGFIITASSCACPIAAMEHASKPWYGLQFHPEVPAHATFKSMIYRFVVDACKCQSTWTSDFIKHRVISNLRALSTAHELVILAYPHAYTYILATLIAQEKIPARFIFIDTGLNYSHERDLLAYVLRTQCGIALETISIACALQKELKEASASKQKMEIIDHILNRTLAQERAHYHHALIIDPGAIYSAAYEGLYDPWQDVFTYDLAQLGHALHLSPFALHDKTLSYSRIALRIIGRVTQKRIALLDNIQQHIMLFLRNRGVIGALDECFAILDPIGEDAYALIIRNVRYRHARAASAQGFEAPLLHDLTSQILSEHPCIKRVLLDVTQVPPALVEWQ